MHLSLLDGDCMELFENKLRAYVDDNPRDWDCLLYLRIDNIEVNFEKVTIKYGVRHRSGWHAAGQILQDKGQLQRHLYRIGSELRVNYMPGPLLRVHFQAGQLKNPLPPEYMRDILTPANVWTSMQG